MKSLRRSLNNGHANGHSHGQSNGHAHAPSQSSSGHGAAFPQVHSGAQILSRPTDRVAPPDKVIRATANSDKQSDPRFIRYTKGDFLYFQGERGDCFEALSE
jgi:hypothetical protein